MKILGVSFGTKNGTNDSLCIEVLKTAKSLGAEVEFIRMSDLEIEHCTGCCVCVKTLLSGNGNMCVLKDDFDWLLDKMLDADGIIVSDPIFEEGASGLFHTITDRFGPRMDRGNNIIGRKIIEEKNGKQMDPRLIKDKVISYMGVGGSDWGTRVQCEHAMHALTPMWKVIDNAWFSWAKDILMDEERLKQVRKIGENLVEAARNFEEATYKGEQGVCPHCHNKLFYLENNSTKAICALCGIEGDVEIQEGKTVFNFPEENREKAHDTLSGKFIHGNDIKTRVEGNFARVRQLPEFKAIKKEHSAFIKALTPEK